MTEQVKSMEDWPNYLPREIPCAHCGVLFPPNNQRQAKRWKYEHIAYYCTPICREAAGAARFDRGHTFGPCPTCDRMFVSQSPKIFCSVKCYVTSDRFKAMIAEKAQNQRGPRPDRQIWDERECLECLTTFLVKPSQPNKFCSRNCYHAYMNKRFDRHIATPDKIEIGQNYDEFLSEDVMKCPIEGCDWQGNWLTLHMNFAHSIRASDFKRAAGFNLTQGVITPALRTALENRESAGVAVDTKLRPGTIYAPPKSGYVSLQRREAVSKMHALKCGEYRGETMRTCDSCGEEFSQTTPFGRQKFCSIKCRTKFYKNSTSSIALTCDVCGCQFHATRDQIRRHKNGMPVVCSVKCRNKLNGSKPRQPRNRVT